MTFDIPAIFSSLLIVKNNILIERVNPNTMNDTMIDCFNDMPVFLCENSKVLALTFKSLNQKLRAVS